jgi:hypothetical protein
MITLPLSSQVPPNYKKEAPKADLRREITPWRALVWAYRDEAVRAASNHEYATDYASTGYTMMQRAETGIGGGTINGVLEAHEDAIHIDAKLQAWCDRDARLYVAIATAGENMRPVPSSDQVPRLRVLPVYRANGQVKMEYRLTGEHRPYLCLVQYEGYSEAEVERVRHVHSMFDSFLRIMPGFNLSKWKIVA